MWLIPDDIASWLSQDLLNSLYEPVSELHYCQIGMTSVVMGDNNAVYTLKCSSIARCARTKRTIPVDQGNFFSRTKTIGDEYIDDLVILSVCNFQT